MKTTNYPIEYEFYQNEKWQKINAEIIVEMPVSLTVNGQAWLTFMCTPVQVEALAIGFLFNEGIIQDFSEVADVRVCEHGDNVDVWLTHEAEKPTKWTRTSGCTGGVTAVESLPDLRLADRLNRITLNPQQIPVLLEMLNNDQTLYRQTGGVHTSVLSDGEHSIIAAEDIGRHNTLDKIAGMVLMENIALKQRIILTTGRISSEMLQKSARLGASVIISRTSPSSMSVELAEKQGVTLIGYARRHRFNVYTHPERIAEVAELEKKT